MSSIRSLCGTALVLVTLASSCGSNKPQRSGTGGSPGGGDDASAPEAGALSACIDRPGELPRPPADGLPCELIPPGLAR